MKLLTRVQVKNCQMYLSICQLTKNIVSIVRQIYIDKYIRITLVEHQKNLGRASTLHRLLCLLSENECCHLYNLLTFSWIFQCLKKKIRRFLTLSSKNYAFWLIFWGYFKLKTPKQFVYHHVLDMFCSCNFLLLNS